MTAIKPPEAWFGAPNWPSTVPFYAYTQSGGDSRHLAVGVVRTPDPQSWYTFRGYEPIPRGGMGYTLLELLPALLPSGLPNGLLSQWPVGVKAGDSCVFRVERGAFYAVPTHLLPSTLAQLGPSVTVHLVGSFDTVFEVLVHRFGILLDFWSFLEREASFIPLPIWERKYWIVLGQGLELRPVRPAEEKAYYRKLRSLRSISHTIGNVLLAALPLVRVSSELSPDPEGGRLLRWQHGHRPLATQPNGQPILLPLSLPRSLSLAYPKLANRGKLKRLTFSQKALDLLLTYQPKNPFVLYYYQALAKTIRLLPQNGELYTLTSQVYQALSSFLDRSSSDSQSHH